MSQRSLLSLLVIIGCLNLALSGCEQRNPAQQKEKEATEQVNKIQQKTDQVQQSVQQSEQQVKDAEKQADPK